MSDGIECVFFVIKLKVMRKKLASIFADFFLVSVIKWGVSRGSVLASEGG